MRPERRQYMTMPLIVFYLICPVPRFPASVIRLKRLLYFSAYCVRSCDFRIVFLIGKLHLSRIASSLATTTTMASESVAPKDIFGFRETCQTRRSSPCYRYYACSMLRRATQFRDCRGLRWTVISQSDNTSFLFKCFSSFSPAARGNVEDQTSTSEISEISRPKQRVDIFKRQE